MVFAALPPPACAEVCIVPRSTGMADLERRLKFAAVAYVGGARPPVSCVDAAIAISEQLEIPRHHFSVHKFHPEDFLVVFASHDLRNRALEVPFIEHPRFKLFTKPWLRQAQAQSKLMRVQVDLMIEGVSSHTWSRETVTELLGSSCLIESLAPETANREDLSLFKLRAWCVDPDDIPAGHRLWVPEPDEILVNPAERVSSFRQLLEYPTLIHIGRLHDHSPPELGLPESSNGSFQGEWMVLPRAMGVCDDRGAGRHSPGHAGGGGQVCSYRQALEGRVGPLAWRIPPMKTGPVSAVEVTGLARHGSQSMRAPPHDRCPECPGELVTPTPPDNTAERANPQETDTNQVLVTPVLADKYVEKDSVPDKELAVIGQADPPLVTAPIVEPRVGTLQRGNLNGPMATDPPAQDSSLAMIASDPVRPEVPCGLLSEENTQFMVPQKIPKVSAVIAVPHGIPEEMGPASGPPLAAGWAPVAELLAPTTTEPAANIPASETVLVGPVLHGLPDVTTSNANYVRTLHAIEAPVQIPAVEPSVELARLSSKEALALGNIKTFCAGLLKKLAPPLLKEIEVANGVRLGQDPLTPRRNTRSLSSTSRSSKASAVETVLLKALGIAPDELAITEGALTQLREMFDSPLQDKHLRTIAAIFGKSLPMELGMENQVVTAI
ncbi:hypothetical protein VPH35_037194 [Triticum aestivum]